MIISHEHKFVFVRTRKTASTSIEIALSRMLGGDAVITALSARDERLRADYGGRRPQNHLDEHTVEADAVVPPGPGPGIRFYNHMPAPAIRAHLGERIWNSYFTFCFERNPWDKVVSLYYHRYRNEPRPPIAEFLDSGEALDAVNYPLYTDENDRIIVDFVGRYEDLTSDLAIALQRVGLQLPARLPTAKSHFRPPNRPYHDVLSDRERRAVAHHFGPEIDLHNYVW